jgi:hypothetical protein
MVQHAGIRALARLRPISSCEWVRGDDAIPFPSSRPKFRHIGCAIVKQGTDGSKVAYRPSLPFKHAKTSNLSNFESTENATVSLTVPAEEILSEQACDVKCVKFAVDSRHHATANYRFCGRSRTENGPKEPSASP